MKATTTRNLLSALLLLLPSLSNSLLTTGRPLQPAFQMLMSRESVLLSSSKSKQKQKQEEQDHQQTESVPLPPVIQSIADERLAYNMNVGKAMDTLRRDYQDILTKKPDFDIYDKDICVIDPSGVQLTGLDKYKSAFAFLQTFCGFWFQSVSRGASGIQFRMMYDFARASIRISWHAVLIPKIPGLLPLHVDGISYYQLDRTAGKIIEHKIENLIINSSPVAPPYGILSLMQRDLLRLRQPQGVPAGVGALSVAGFE